MQEGFTLTTTPDLARNEILEGIGFNPRGPETQVYSIENTDLSLVGTAEITLGGMYSGQTLDAEQLPIKICGISHCFRTEAGAHGAGDPRHLSRAPVHQGRDVRLHAARGQRRDARRSCWRSSARSSTAWAFPTA